MKMQKYKQTSQRIFETATKEPNLETSGVRGGGVGSTALTGKNVVEK